MRTVPRRIDLGPSLAALGAVLLLVSLFLSWYQPELTGWDAFETLDLVLAALAVLVLVVLAERFGWEGPVRDTVLPVVGLAALLIVVSQLVNKPPAARTADLDTGAWLALAGAALMLAGGVAAVARVSVAVTLREKERVAKREREPESARTAESSALPADDEPLRDDETLRLKADRD
jgi:hypothetical protein